MRRVVGLVAFCSMLFSVGYVSNVSAARDYNQLRLEQLKKDPKVVEYLKLLKQQQNTQGNQSSNQTTRSKKKKKKKKNRTNQMTQQDSQDQDQIQTSGQTTRSKKKKKKKKNRNRNNQMNQMQMSNDMDSSDEFVLNEPIIDNSKLKESSLVIEKNIKLASKTETKKLEKKIAAVKSKSLPKKETLVAKAELKTDSKTDVKLALNSVDSAQKIKEQLQQISNDRNTYNLIWTPNKKLKNNIEVNEFRAELNHYRKLYTSNLKNA